MRSSLPLVLVGCLGQPADIVFDTPADFTITVEPAELSIVTGPDGAEPVSFSATATFLDGTVAPLEAVEWTVSNRSVGSIDDAGLFAPTDATGGATWITAEADGVKGRAEVLVQFEDVRTAEGVDPSVFDVSRLPAADLWLYPPDGVNLPRNMPALHLMWAGEEGATWELDFRSQYTNVRFYTAEPQLVLSALDWQTIAATNAGGTVEVTLAVARSNGEVAEEPPRLLNVNRMDAEGSVIYWTTTLGGLVEVPFGQEAVDYLTQEQTGHCVGCHVISSGGKIAFTYDGGNQGLGLKWVQDQADIIPYESEAVGNFKTISPDERFVLSTYQGNLKLYDGVSGAFLNDVRTEGTMTHVDWSPDGSRVVFTLTQGHVNDWVIPVPDAGTGTQSRIAVLEHLGDGAFGSWEVVHTPAPGWNAYYPTWSPDGRWIAFNQSQGDANNDADAELWVIDAEGERPAIRLAAATGPADPTGTVVTTNSWPRWSPLPDDEVLWLAFSSTRPYGFLAEGTPQIWVAGFDPARAEAGEDPSWPAFRLPGQSLETSNHNPFWTR